MKIGILQFHRVGDIVMSLSVIRAIRIQYPEAEIHLINRERFSVQNIQEFNYLKTHVFKTAEVLSKDNVRQMVKEIVTFANEIPSFDLVINLSFSPTALALTRLLKFKKIIGPYKDEEGVEVLDDDFSFYIRSHIQGGDGSNRLHLTTLWLQLAGVSKDKFLKLSGYVVEEEKVKTNKIAIHVGASSDNKNLSVPDWVTLLKMVENRFPTHEITVLGGQAELSFASLLTKHFPKVTNLVGKTQIDEVYNIIKNSDGFIGVDSMAAHLAALANTLSLAIFVDDKTTNPFETLGFSRLSYGCKGDLPSIVATFENLMKGEKIEHYRNAKVFGWMNDMSGVIIKSHHSDTISSRYRSVWMTIARNERLERFHFAGIEENLFRDIHGLKQFIRSVEITSDSIRHLDPKELPNRLMEIRELQRTLYAAYIVLHHPCEELWLEESILRGSIVEMMTKYQAVMGSILNSCRILDAGISSIINEQLKNKTDIKGVEKCMDQNPSLKLPETLSKV